jgi:tryptophanase
MAALAVGLDEATEFNYLETRVEQVAAFASVSDNKDKLGWNIVRRNDEEVAPSDKGEIERIIKF